MTYETNDLYIAAALRSLGYKMKVIKTGYKALFVFTGDDIEEKVSKFWDKTLQVDARSFVDSIQELKTRIYSER